MGGPVRVVPARGGGCRCRCRCPEDFVPDGTGRDAETTRTLDSTGAELVAVRSAYAVPPARLHDDDRRPNRVFTPFAEAWRAAGWERPPPRPRVAHSQRAIVAQRTHSPSRRDRGHPPHQRARAPPTAALHRFLERQVDN